MQATDLFAKYAKEWKLESGDIEVAAQLFTKDYGNEGAQTPSKLLLFLYAKRILAEEDPIIRKAEFEDLLAADTAELEKALERLTTIVQKGETKIYF